MKFLDKIPLLPLSLAALFLALAPVKPQPHLWEKLTMLFDGELRQAIDVFDLFMHGSLLLVLLVKLLRLAQLAKQGPGPD